MNKAEARFRRRDQVIKQETSGTLVLVTLDDGECYGLNEVGGRVWDLCDGSLKASEIASIVAQEYDAPEATVMADVIDILEDLAGAELVVANS